MKKILIIILIITLPILAQDITNKLGGKTATETYDVTDSDDALLFRVQGDGNVGIGAAGPVSKLSVGGNGLSSSVIYGESATDLGRAVEGNATLTGWGITNYGGYFTAAGSSGRAVYGNASSTEGGYTNYGGYFVANSGTGRGIQGVATGFNGVGVYGGATITGDYYTFGGRFSAVSNHGTGVYGYASGLNGKGVVGDGGSYDFDAVGIGVNYGSTSSIRWKRNIIEISDPLEKLAEIRGVYFDWDLEHGGGHDVGCIAEEIGKVLPEIVVYEENGIDANGMDYSKLTPLLIEAIKAQQVIIKDLQNRITMLENK